MTPEVFRALTVYPSEHRKMISNQIHWHLHEVVDLLEENGCLGENYEAAIALLHDALENAEKSLAFAEASTLKKKAGNAPKKSVVKKSVNQKLRKSCGNCSSNETEKEQELLLEMAGLVAEAFHCLGDYVDVTGRDIPSLRDKLFGSFAEVILLMPNKERTEVVSGENNIISSVDDITKAIKDLQNHLHTKAIKDLQNHLH